MTQQPDVIDYSSAHPVLAQLPASVVGVARYLRGTTAGKAITADEASAIHASGRFIVVNDETGAGRAALGKSAGQTDGAAAGAAARVLGIPAPCVIHPSVDFDVTTQMAAVEQYMIGYQSESGYGQGAYGEADVLDALDSIAALTTGFGWQSSAWSGGRRSSHAAMLQYLNGQAFAGGTVDFNQLINLAGLGAWMPAVAPAPTRSDMNFRVMQNPKANDVWAVGDTWAIYMSSPAVLAVWMSDGDCLSPAVEKPDQTHWDQRWRRVIDKQGGPSGSLADARTAAMVTALTPEATEITALTAEIDGLAFPTVEAIVGGILAASPASGQFTDQQIEQIHQAVAAAIAGATVTSTINQGAQS